MNDIEQLAKPIKLLITDVDGVLTDGGLYYANDGNEFKRFNVQDGLWIQLLQRSGVPVAVITGKTSNIVQDRMEKLNIEFVYQGRQNKVEAYEELLQTLNVTDEQVAYVGDDLLDLPLFKRVHFAISVPNGTDFVKSHADWITSRPGGQGALQEVCECIMKAQNTLETTYQHYLDLK